MPDNDSTGKLRRNWRFITFLILIAIGWSVGIRNLGLERGLLVGFDVAAAFFLLACVPLLSLPAAEVRKVAPADDLNRALRLAISLLVSIVIFAAMTAQLVDRQALNGTDKLLVGVTLVLVWTFANTIYTVHYAHLYYSPTPDGSDCEGLIFPGGGRPTLADFAYFAFTLGVAVQTADVAISSPRVRRVVTIHAILGFFFNIGVLSLSIGLLGAS
jgi:uncharacterized membrane protein